LFVNFRLDQQIPADNFYKILKQVLDLNFIYEDTKDAYSNTGRPGIDPVVFFKILLVGYLENICSDRALERLFQLRLDLLYFIDHNIGDKVPDHSTIYERNISRSGRGLYDL
jgi:transposase